MDAAFLSRLQFALTAGFHFIFPPLTIGLAWHIFLTMTRYWRTGDEAHGRAARFWIGVFALSFTVGVASGIPLEFQFGTNWASYARFVGDIFGAPLAAEGILSFFLESSFLAVLALGWKRFSVRTLWFASLMVAVGATLSAFWIIVANSWMQTPSGFAVVGGRAELTDFWAAVFNPSTAPRYLHTIAASFITGAFFVLAVGAWYLLKGRHRAFAMRSVRSALIAALVLSVVQGGIGHWHAMQVARTQPEKLAAVEGLFETQRRAPALVFGIPDEDAGTMRAAVRIPGLLSLLAFGDLDAEVKGLNDFPRDEWPPLALTFFPFHAMVGLGMLLIGVPALGLLLLWLGRLEKSRWFLWIAALCAPLPFIANELGWITAEVGRQPWAVYRLLRTSDSVSASVPAEQILASLVGFAVVYLALFVLWIHLLRLKIARGPEEASGEAGAKGAAS